MMSGVSSCFNLHVLQVPVRLDGVKMEPGVPKVDGDHVKREHSESILTEEGDGMFVCVYNESVSKILLSICVRLTVLFICVLVRGEDGENRGEGDDGTRGMELDLVEGSVPMAAAAALSSAASKAKVKLTLSNHMNI